ncbi:hypothetical protein N7540_005434 [Penicillium herquei]|nr:hypothetical protein N7540_005434 [Penicillium herquei]
MYLLRSLLLLNYIAPFTWGWGDLGHRTVAYSAEKYLNEEDAQLVEDLILDGDFDISDAATHQVRDTTPDTTQQGDALKFLIHFIGDLHQPLHVEDKYRGGNNIHVCFDNHCSRNSNLHSVWDTDIPHKLNGLKHSLKHNEEKEPAIKWAEKLF